VGGLFQRIDAKMTAEKGQRLDFIDLLKVVLTVGIVFRHA
jgi:hypothetical protein